MNLYKFRVVNTNNLSALATNKLWFSDLSAFNDPFEGTYRIDNLLPDSIIPNFKLKPKDEIDKKVYRQALTKRGIKEDNLSHSEFLQAIAEHDLKQLIKIVHDTKVVCFSLYDKKKDPIKENLMWSHYADGLRGFCMVFDDNKLVESINESTKMSIRPIHVTYQDNPNVLKLIDFLNSDFVLNNHKKNYVTIVTESLATKSIDWMYENEFRFLSLDKKQFHTYSSESLLEIVIGDKMPSDQKKLVVDTAKSVNPNIVIKKACLILNTFQLEIVDFDSNDDV